MVEKKRLTAIKSRIDSIINGKYVKQEGMNPNYVLTKDGVRISRARILATVVDKFVSDDKKFFSITLDDGNGTIRAKTFGSLLLDNISIGDILDVIGRVREFNEEIYIVPEVVFKVDPNFELLRELEIREAEKDWQRKKETVLKYSKQVSDLDELKELMKEFGISQEDVESILQSQEIEEEIEETKAETKVTKDMILGLIEKLDSGVGCDYSELIEASNLPEDVLDPIIEELLNDGSCFEPRPGKIKKL